MSRIKTIVEQGKQDLGISTGNGQNYGHASQNSDRAGKLVHQYTTTQSVTVDSTRLRENRVISQLSNDMNARRFQVLRTKILQQMRKKSWNTLAISAPTPGAGKSFVASNLAVSIAMEGNQSVLLVDMDLSKPRVHSYFGIDPEYGIHDYLDGTASVEQILVNPGLERLVLLPGKRGIMNSSDQMSAPIIKNLVHELKSRYESRIVIFDLPPILISDEALVFLPYVDCSLLVVESGKNTTKEVETSLEAIGSNPLLGTVLNKSESAGRLPVYN